MSYDNWKTSPPEHDEMPDPPFQCVACGAKLWHEEEPCDCPEEAVDELSMIGQSLDSCVRDLRRLLTDAVVAGDLGTIGTIESLLLRWGHDALTVKIEAGKFWHDVRIEQLKKGAM